MPTLQEMMQNNPRLQTIIEESARRNIGPDLSSTQMSDPDKRTLEERTSQADAEELAMCFYAALMTRINTEFGYMNPSWENLGYREKRLWIESSVIVYEEYAKAKVKGALPGQASRRVIE